jgi:hypothetical protein
MSVLDSQIRLPQIFASLETVSILQIPSSPNPAMNYFSLSLPSATAMLKYDSFQPSVSSTTFLEVNNFVLLGVSTRCEMLRCRGKYQLLTVSL